MRVVSKLPCVRTSRGMFKKTPILVCIAAVLTLSIISCGEELSPSLNATSAREVSIDLLTAIDEERNIVVQEILNLGIDPNKVPVPVGIPLEGAYPLHLAIVKGNKEVVNMLLDHGARIDLEAKNKDGATPLHWAAFFGQKEMIPLLIAWGAPINKLDNNHATPVDAAVFAWRHSQDNEDWAENMMNTINILKSYGGKPADELQD